MPRATKTTTKTTTKKTTKKSDPSPETSPRFKKLVKAGLIGPDTVSHLGDADAIEASKAHYAALGAAADAPPATEIEDFKPADESTREVAEEGFASREPATPPAGFPIETPGLTLEALGHAWIHHLRATGSTESTALGYGRDFTIACEVLGSATPLELVTPESVLFFEAAFAVNKKRNGEPRAKPSIMRTKRVLRLAFTWAVATGRATSSPYATKAVGA